MPNARTRYRRGIADLWSLYKLGSITKNVFEYWSKKSPSAQKSFVQKQKKTDLKQSAEINKLKKEVSKLKKQADIQFATHVHRRRDTGRLIVAGANQMSQTQYNNGRDELEAAAANLRWYNPATNALVTADPTDLTAQNDIMVKSIFYKMTVRNNYQIPVDCTVYSISPKEDTSINCLTAFTNGLADQGNPTSTSPLVYLTDSEQFKELYKIDKSNRMILQPGEQRQFTFAVKSFKYDSSLIDSHNLEFQKSFGAHSWVLRVQGVISHDSSVTTEQALGFGGIDFYQDIVYTFEYDAGVELNDYSIDDNASTSFTNTALSCNYPVSDLQAFSIS